MPERARPDLLDLAASQGTVVGPPADSNYVRIVHRAKDDVDLYTGVLQQ